MCFSVTFLLLGREQGVTFAGSSLASKVFPCIRVCQEHGTPFRQSSFPRRTAPEGSCSLPGLCTGMWRLEKRGASGSPSTPPEECRLFSSLQPLGIGRAIPETRFFEQKEFISTTANVMISHGTRVEISWEMCISRFPSADKTLSETPAPAPAAAGTGAGGAARGDIGASRLCRADALLWKPGK